MNLLIPSYEFEYFVNRKISGNFALRQSIERWRPDQRERFEAELRRLKST